MATTSPPPLVTGQALGGGRPGHADPSRPSSVLSRQRLCTRRARHSRDQPPGQPAGPGATHPHLLVVIAGSVGRQCRGDAADVGEHLAPFSRDGVYRRDHRLDGADREALEYLPQSGKQGDPDNAAARPGSPAFLPFLNRLESDATVRAACGAAVLNAVEQSSSFSPSSSGAPQCRHMRADIDDALPLART